MAEKTDLIENLAYGVDLKNRRIYFGINLDGADTHESTDFTVSSVEYAVRALHRMASDAPGRPIEIHMCSYGGDPYAMLRLYDEIHACPCQIKFYGSGAIMSAATWIMVGCDERYLHPHTTIMVHDGSDGWEGRHTDGQIMAAEMRRLQDLLYDIYAENTRMPKAFWQDVCQRDLYLTAQEAVALGLADKIVEPKKRGNLRKMRYASLKKEPDRKEMKKLITRLYERINKVNIPKIDFNEIKKEASDPDLIVKDESFYVEQGSSEILQEVKQ
ncbi:MAG: ATP-dependent Clp protease proteolytic subunit [Nitrososphaerales archaeon]